MKSSRSSFLCAAACCVTLGLATTPGVAFGQSAAQQVESQSYEQQQAPPSGGWRKVGDPPTVTEQASYPGVQNPEVQNSGVQNPGNGVHVYDPNPDGNRNQQERREPSPPPQQLTVQPGSYITVRVNQQLSSNKNHVGDMFTATLEQPLVVNGIVVASPGETVSGRVTEVEKAGRIEGLARLGVQLTELSLVDGQQVPIQSQFIDQVGPGSKGRDAGTIAGTTAAGAAIGAAAGWGVGAAIGAGAGAAASTIGVLVTRGHASVIGPEQILTFRIVQPVTIATVSAPQAFRYVDPNEYGYYSQASQQQTIQYRQAANPPAPYYGYGGYGYGAPYYDPYAYGAGFGFGYPYYGWGGYPYWGSGVGIGFYYGPGWYGRGWGGRDWDRGGWHDRDYGGYRGGGYAHSYAGGGFHGREEFHGGGGFRGGGSHGGGSHGGGRR